MIHLETGTSWKLESSFTKKKCTLMHSHVQHTWTWKWTTRTHIFMLLENILRKHFTAVASIGTESFEPVSIFNIRRCSHSCRKTRCTLLFRSRLDQGGVHFLFAQEYLYSFNMKNHTLSHAGAHLKQSYPRLVMVRDDCCMFSLLFSKCQLSHIRNT